MTRFARAKGSKASNERAPEDGTPWEVMKEQLLKAKKEGEEAKKRQEAEQQRIQNYENFLQERKVQKRPATWCDFPEAEKESNIVKHVNMESVGSKKKKKKKHANNVQSYEISNETCIADSSVEVPKKKKNKQKHLKDIASVVEKDPGNNNEKSTKKKKKRKVESKQQHETIPELSIINDDVTDSIPSKKKKKKNKRSQIPVEESPPIQDFPEASEPSEWKKTKKPKPAALENDTTKVESSNELGNNNQGNTSNEKKNKQKKNKKASHNNGDSNENNEDNQKNYANQQNKVKAKKKLLDGVPARRKEITERSFQLIINGKEIELIRFDGFPIMKKDAERLTELKNSMIKKGIPKSEVQRTMKLERRRAEKALARLKRDVCYNCRKGGHNLSDCPELKTKIPGVDGADGICFKCGSTEHRQFECKVQRDKEFRFATCFICKESGHIARQCPDNPKGLYPNGGCCKLCGDVTHLRKDCPTQNNKKEESSVKLHTLDATEGIEDIGLQNSTVAASHDTAKKPKKIKF